MTFNIFKTIQRFRKNRKGFSLIEISVVILIIGVLIAGISQASDMIDDAALKGARTASKGSRVGRIKDLVLWLDATSDGASLTANNKQAVDGDFVASVKDLNPMSSNRLTLTGPAAANYPTYVSNKLSGLPGLHFFPTTNGGTTTFNYLKLSDKFDNSTGEYTIYLVYQPVTLPTSTSFVIMEKRSTGGVFPYKLELESNGFYKLSDNNGSVSAKKKSSTGKVNLIRLNRSSAGALTIIVDDVMATSTPGTIASVVNSGELIIGAQNAATPTNFINGRIGELIIYERDLVGSEKTDIETYLYKKWKIEKDATRVSACVVTTANAAVGATLAQDATSFACLPGYTFSSGATPPSCSGAPNLTYTAGTAACNQSHCFVPAALKVTQTMVPPGACTLNCKNGGTAPTACNCPGSGNWTLTYTGGSCT